MKSYSMLEMDVIRWAEARGIVKNSTPMAQARKTMEELSELFRGLDRGNLEETKDAYGDILVTLIVGCACHDLDLVECLNGAYEEIKDRKGYLNEQGVFVKEAT